MVKIPAGIRNVFVGAGADLSIAFRNVLRHRRRSLSGISSVSFGIIALLLAAGFIEWTFWAMREGTIRSGLGHVQIMREGYLESGRADPFAFLLPNDSPERKRIEQSEGVKSLAPRLSFSGLISKGESTLSFIGEGIDPARESGLATAMRFSAGGPLADDDPNSVILGEGLAANLGANVGDTVILLANTRSGGMNAVEVKVKGIFNTSSQAYDEAALRLPLATTQNLLRVKGVHLWVLLLEETRLTESTVASLRNNFPNAGLQFVPWSDLADFYNKTVVLFSKQVRVMKVIIALIIILSISNTLTMSVLERTSEIGTCLALGNRRLQIIRQFLGEGFALGIVGGIVGLLAGGLLASLISAIGIPMPPPPGMARAYTGEIRLTTGLALDAFVLAVLTTLAASIYPAWRASKMEIVDALRHSR
ncbi:MAG TPA: FtsX-like permease family protein [Burkholderiales bacterium]|nr:FtsX-like permease family protein [Burkholderiales bacterium]